MEKLLLESKSVLTPTAAIPAADAQITFTKAPFIQYEQILLDILRMGDQKTPLQKTYEKSKGTESLNVELLGFNRQFDWLEISIISD